MYRSDLRLEAVTSAERMGVVAAMDEAIGAVGGWIQDSNFFSDISVAIRCGVPALGIADLLTRFHVLGIKFDAPLMPDPADGTSAIKELNVSINVTFANHRPDLRRSLV